MSLKLVATGTYKDEKGQTVIKTGYAEKKKSLCKTCGKEERAEKSSRCKECGLNNMRNKLMSDRLNQKISKQIKS